MLHQLAIPLSISFTTNIDEVNNEDDGDNKLKKALSFSKDTNGSTDSLVDDLFDEFEE